MRAVGKGQSDIEGPPGTRRQADLRMSCPVCNPARAQHPRGAMLLEAGFDAVRTVVLAVRAALTGDTDGDAVYRLAYYAGARSRRRLQTGRRGSMSTRSAALAVVGSPLEGPRARPAVVCTLTGWELVPPCSCRSVPLPSAPQR